MWIGSQEYLKFNFFVKCIQFVCIFVYTFCFLCYNASIGEDLMIEKFSDIRFGHGIFNKECENQIYDVSEIEILKTLTFNSFTKFVDEENAKHLIEYGKQIPFNIAKLHEKGVDGKGVNVAIIDQPLALDHPEYKGQIAEYKEFKPADYDMGISSMHGPAVMSLLVGKTIGVAPHANVYYCACPSWLADAKYYAEAIEHIIDINKRLDQKEKIKFISVSAAPSGKHSPFTSNNEMWDKAVSHAKEEGIVVVDCTEDKGFVYPGFIDYKENKLIRGFPNRKFKNREESLDGVVFAPTSLRTVAESYDNKTYGYTYCGVGGLSWGIPYITGLLCLGQQVNPQLSADEIKEILLRTAKMNVPNPQEFIEVIENYNNNININSNL